MRFKIIIILTLILLVSMASCKNTPEIQTIWINSAKVDCVGVGPMQCMQIKLSSDAPWTNLYQEIEGFTYEPGYIYQVSVEAISLDPKKVPADASSIRYSLKKIISKKPDNLLLLNDIWVLTNIESTNLKGNKDESLPYIELNTRQMTVLGSDGCNNLRGSIKQVNDSTIIFGPIMATKKACPDMTIAMLFNKNIELVKFYNQKPGILLLQDENKNTLLSFKKID